MRRVQQPIPSPARTPTQVTLDFTGIENAVLLAPGSMLRLTNLHITGLGPFKHSAQLAYRDSGAMSLAPTFWFTNNATVRHFVLVVFAVSSLRVCVWVQPAVIVSCTAQVALVPTADESRSAADPALKNMAWTVVDCTEVGCGRVEYIC